MLSFSSSSTPMAAWHNKLQQSKIKQKKAKEKQTEAEAEVLY